MRQKTLKTKCVKRRIIKCSDLLRTYDIVQETYANHLESDDDVVTVYCNVPIEDLSIGDFTTDYVLIRKDGSTAVRECVLRKNLLRPRTVKLLDFSQRYWLKKGVTDWLVIIDAEKK